MKRLLIIAWLAMHSICLAQNDQANLEKYWKFRNAFREKFIKIGSQQGESLPAGALLPYDCQDNTYNDGIGYGEMRWGDGMIRHGHYLGLLATEYRLLKNNGQDVSGVLNELYYALNAINRLDKRAEPDQDEFYGLSLNENLNGFYLREDIPEDFAITHWYTDSLHARCTNSSFYRNNNSEKINIPSNNLVNRGNGYQNVPSLDQMTSLMVGFSLIHKLVDDEFVKPTAADTGFFVVTETKAIVRRMLFYAKNHNWLLIDVNGWPVANGGGDLILAAYPLSLAGTRITGDNYHSNATRQIINNLGNVQQCITGFGSKGEGPIHQQAGCDAIDFIDFGQNLAMNDLETGVPAGPLNSQYNSVYQSWVNGGNTFSTTLTDNFWLYEMPYFFPTVYEDWLADHKFSSLPFPFSQLKFNSLNFSEYNNTIYFNLGVVSGLWNSSQVKGWADHTGNRQMELVNAIITNSAPAEIKAYYQGYLDNLPATGPYNIHAGNYIPGVGSTHLDSLKQGNGWAAEYRWTNPSASMGVGGERGIYSGLDYMLYHNLYRLIFMPATAYAPTTNCFCGSAIAKTVGGSSGQMDATTNLNKKLALLETCITDVFAAVNQSINGTFNIEPKFPNYAAIGILTSDYQTNHATVQSGADVNVRNLFVICNSRTLTHQTGGKINVEKGSVIINPSSRINNYGDIRIKTGTRIIINNLGRLTLNAGSKLIIEDGAKLVIEAGGILEYYNGAQIITQGDNNEIVLRGNIKVMNAGIFSIDHSASAGSGRLILDGGGFTAEQPATTIDLKGKGSADEFIVILPSRKLWIEDIDISLFKLDKCRIELPTDSKIWAQQPFSSTDVAYHCATHCIGIELTEKSDFTNCDFTDVWMNAQLAVENKGKLALTNCHFSRNATLSSFAPEYVLVNGMGYTIYNCTFTNTRLNGITSFALTYPSTVSASTFTQNTVQGRGIKETSAVELIVKGCSFNNMYQGIYKSSGKLSLKCNTFQDNKNANLSVLGGCLLNMSTDDHAGYNYLYKTTENKNVLFTDASANVNNGYNYIDDNGISIFQGTLNHLCPPLTVCSLGARKNQWNAGNTQPSASKFSLTLTTGGMTYPVNTATPVLKPMCGYYDAPDPGNPNDPNGKSMTLADGMPIIQTSFNDSVRLDSAIVYAINLMELNDSLGNDLEAVEAFNDVFKSGLSKVDTVAGYWLEFSLHHMKSALENAFSTGRLTRVGNALSFNKHVAMYAHALVYMTDSIIDTYNYVPQFYHEMNKAHLFRLIGHPSIGLDILTALEACGLDSAEQQCLNYWKTEYSKDLVIAEIGMDAMDTTIIIDTANYNLPLPLVLNEYYFGAQINSLHDISYPNCEFYTPDKMMKEESNPEFALFPNPAEDMVNIVLNHTMTAGTTSTLVFQATDGKVMFKTTYTETENSTRTINVSTWKTGVYLYKYTIASGKTYTGKIVVK